jgi:hypothetical protein
MSLTGTNTAASTCSTGDALRTAVCAVVGRGIPVVAAAGNQGVDAGSTIPAKYPEVIAVAAITDYDGRYGGGASRPADCGEVAGGNGADDTLADYSNRGSVVDIAAPGTCILSTTSNGSYGLMSGTSMASPAVAGTLGLYKAMNPGSSESSARTWLLSGYGSQPRGTPYAYTGDLSARMLYPNKPVAGTANASLTSNPSFGGQKLPIVSSRGSSGTTGSGRVYDNSTSTSWNTTTSGTPTSAWFDVDLGTTRQLTGVKWMFSRAGGADKMLVRTSNDRVNWEIVGTYSNNGSLQTYYGANVNRTARYVGFSFSNPNAQPVLGYVSEMQVWGTAADVYTPGSSGPVFTGGDLRIVSSRGSSNASGSGRAWDNSVSSSWYTTVPTPSSAWFDVDLGTTRQLSGIKWMFKGTTAADQMLVRTSMDRVNWTTVGTFRNGAYDSTWYGTALNRNARYVGFSFSNPNRDSQIGLIREIEIWGQPYTASTITSASLRTASTPTATPVASPPASPSASPSASPMASPAASPAASPVASPAASPSASPMASPAASPAPSPAASPAVSDPGTPLVDASPAVPTPGGSPGATPAVEAAVPTATPGMIVEPTATVAATAEPTGTTAPTAEPTQEPTATTAPAEAPTATTAPTEEPTATLVGMVVGTGGEGVRCRTAPSTDAGEITTVPEGDEVSVLGPNVDGWIPVICGDGQNGYIAAQFLAVGDDPAAPAVETVIAEDDAATEDIAEETALAEETVAIEETVVAEEPTATEEVVPTDEPADLTYTVVDTADSEQSGTGYQVVDGDTGTIWLVQASISPDETWLLLDLGQVQPVDRVTWELGISGSLPPFEIWLSEDGSTWWNASEVNGWNLEAGVEYEAALNVWTRYVMFVVPGVDESGLAEVGGFSEIEVWPADGAQSLDALGSPVTPAPAPRDIPVEETVEDIPVDEAVTEAPPDESATEDEETIEETPLDGSEPESEPEGTTEETPPPQN